MTLSITPFGDYTNDSFSYLQNEKEEFITINSNNEESSSLEMKSYGTFNSKKNKPDCDEDKIHLFGSHSNIVCIDPDKKIKRIDEKIEEIEKNKYKQLKQLDNEFYKCRSKRFEITRESVSKLRKSDNKRARKKNNISAQKLTEKEKAEKIKKIDAKYDKSSYLLTREAQKQFHVISCKEKKINGPLRAAVFEKANNKIIKLMKEEDNKDISFFTRLKRKFGFNDYFNYKSLD